FAVVGVDGCVKSASISTPGTITVTVDENTSESRVEGDVIIASKAYPDVTAKVQIIQAAKGEKEPLDKPQDIDFEVTATDLTAIWRAVNNATKYGYRVVYKADETATGEEIANGETNDAEISISASSLGLTEFAAGEYVLYVKSLGNENYADSDEASAEISFGGTSGGNKATYTLTFPDNNKGSNNNGNYTGKWTAKIEANTWTIDKFNNNNWASSWSYIKCGSKNAASVATITTDWAIAEAIEKVIVTIDAVTATSVNSTYLEVATDADFSNILEKVTVSIAKGDLVYAITNPVENCYYRLTYDCKKASSNGPVQISKVVYTNE
ncbi:MAG: hypothetical protein J6J75_02670, partial [Alistipes sp.]|nr:hypothetical protein [Alistipes sp.]